MPRCSDIQTDFFNTIRRIPALRPWIGLHVNFRGGELTHPTQRRHTSIANAAVRGCYPRVHISPLINGSDDEVIVSIESSGNFPRHIVGTMFLVLGFGTANRPAINHFESNM
jgi:hypothetical protein